MNKFKVEGSPSKSAVEEAARLAKGLEQTEFASVTVSGATDMGGINHSVITMTGPTIVGSNSVMPRLFVPQEPQPKPLPPSPPRKSKKRRPRKKK